MNDCNECKPALLCEELRKEVNELKANQQVGDEKYKIIFKILDEIKDSVKTISDKLDLLEKKPGQKWDDLIKTIITVIASMAVTFLFTIK